LQQLLPSVPQLSCFLPQQEQPQLQPQLHLPLIKNLIKAAIDNTNATFIKVHITTAWNGTGPFKNSCIIALSLH
jgi:hypothetical protein